jgi:NADP-dependent 3-hydroxy acid dehydrogenase YdfG
MDLSAQTVAITGATSGLGEAIAFEIARLGGNVILLGRNIEKLSNLSSNLLHKYPKQKFFSYQLDVINNQWVESVFQQIKDNGIEIDVLVNNAGVILKKKLEETSEQDIHTVVDTNIKGVIFCTRAVLTGMKERNRGKIINISSNQGKVARAEQSVYGATKFAVRGFSEALQKELLKTDVHVYGIYPAGMKTDLFNRAGYSVEDFEKCMEPSDVAKIIGFMLTQPCGVHLEDVTISRNYC